MHHYRQEGDLVQAAVQPSCQPHVHSHQPLPPVRILITFQGSYSSNRILPIVKIAAFEQSLVILIIIAIHSTPV